MQSNVKTYFIIILITLLAGGIFGYTYYRTQDLIRGPRIEISYPVNGSTLDTSLITIEGVARNIASITLNDRKIFVDEDGGIREDILLTYGYNVLTLKAEDKFGRKVTHRLELVYK